MKQNLDTLDRVLRFALAFWWVGPLAPNTISAEVNFIIPIIGWIALIESFIGWCWLHKLIGIKK